MINALDRNQRFGSPVSRSPVPVVVAGLIALATGVGVLDGLVAGHANQGVGLAVTIALFGSCIAAMMLESVWDTYRQYRRREYPIEALLRATGGPGPLPTSWFEQIRNGPETWQSGMRHIEDWLRRALPDAGHRETFALLAREYDGTWQSLVETVRLLEQDEHA